VVWGGIELRKVSAAELRVDAVRHVAGEKEVGVVDI
jgi:hypothetical protein